MNSTNSSRPPCLDSPFGTGGCGAGNAAASTKTPPASTPSGKSSGRSGRKPGKQVGAKGKWRDEPLKAERAEHHWPATCAGCGMPLEMWDKEMRTGAAFPVLGLERTPGGIRIACVEHRYQIVLCTCGHETEARPATGVLSFLDGRKRQLHLTERCMVDPSLAAFIAVLHTRHHQSRRNIREFLLTWMGVPLSVGSIDRCIREVGVACEPVAEALLEEVRAAGIIHADETPWYQGVLNRWLWVVVTATTAVVISTPGTISPKPSHAPEPVSSITPYQSPRDQYRGSERVPNCRASHKSRCTTSHAIRFDGYAIRWRNCTYC
jgi:hypothetical protein